MESIAINGGLITSHQLLVNIVEAVQLGAELIFSEPRQNREHGVFLLQVSRFRLSLLRLLHRIGRPGGSRTPIAALIWPVAERTEQHDRNLTGLIVFHSRLTAHRTSSDWCTGMEGRGTLPRLLGVCGLLVIQTLHLCWGAGEVEEEFLLITGTKCV